MQIKCNNTLFSKVISLIQKTIPAMNTASKNLIKLTANNNDSLIIETTDYKNFIKMNLPVEVIKPGEITISIKYLADIIHKNYDNTITIQKNENNNSIRLSYSNAVFDILTVDDNIPFIKNIVSDNVTKINLEVLKKLIDKTIFACSNHHHDSALSGAFLTKDSNKIKLMASDSYTLAYSYENIKDTDTNNYGIIIPGKTLNEVLSIITYIDDSEQHVDISWTATQIAFAFKDIYFTSSLIRGKYPNLESKFSNDYDIKIQIKTKDLLHATERVALLTDDKKNINVAKISVCENIFHINTNNPEIGMADDNIPCDISGNDIELLINPLYVINILKRIDDENVFIGINSNVTPVLFKPMSDDSYKYLLPPIRSR